MTRKFKAMVVAVRRPDRGRSRPVHFCAVSRGFLRR